MPVSAIGERRGALVEAPLAIALPVLIAISCAWLPITQALQVFIVPQTSAGMVLANRIGTAICAAMGVGVVTQALLSRRTGRTNQAGQRVLRLAWVGSIVAVAAIFFIVAPQLSDMAGNAGMDLVILPMLPFAGVVIWLAALLLSVLIPCKVSASVPISYTPLVVTAIVVVGLLGLAVFTSRAMEKAAAERPTKMTELLTTEEIAGARDVSEAVFRSAEAGDLAAFLALAAGDPHADPEELTSQLERMRVHAPTGYSIDEDSVEVLTDAETGQRIAVVSLTIIAESANDMVTTPSGPLYLERRNGRWGLTGIVGR